MKTICISLGGSVLYNENGIDIDYVKSFADMIKKEKAHRFLIVTGGGRVSKEYIEKLRESSMPESILDEIGIAFSRINAQILLSALDEDTYAKVITTLDELKTAKSKIMVMGGLVPGITTDAVATLGAEVLNCKNLVNVSRNAFIYDRPPEEKGAKRIEKLNYSKLIELANKFDSRNAKSNFVFDLVACKIAARSDIEVRFVDKEIMNIKKAIKGSTELGTVVQ